MKTSKRFRFDRALCCSGREALTRNIFDGYKANPNYAIKCLQAAMDAGARWIVLCDTNGGALPSEVKSIVTDVIAAGILRIGLGIHTHNDTENAVANSLAAVDGRAPNSGDIEWAW